MVTVFAYGSNMCSGRLRRRIGSARFLGTARLPGYGIRFAKRGKDGSGKATIWPTRRLDDVVWGVLFQCSPEDKEALDRIEGLGAGYDEDVVAVATRNRTLRTALAYVAQPTWLEDALVPFTWYVGYVIAGAMEWGLPEDYIRRLSAEVSCADPDAVRARENELPGLAITAGA